MARLPRLLLPLLLAAPPALGQAAGGPPPGVRSTPAGFMLDFDDQDVRVVLTAIAAAAGVNLTFTALPAQKTTLRMGTPVSREALVGVLRDVAESNGLRVTEAGSLLRIEAPPQRNPAADAAAQRLAQLQQQSPQLQLFAYRLRHASAQDLAQVLTAIFSGVPVNRSITVTGPGGVQVFTPALPPGAGTVPVPSAGAGNVTVQPNVVGPGGVNRPGGAGRPGAGAPPVPPGGAVAGAAAAAQQLAAQTAALSALAGEVRIVAEVGTNSLIVRATAQDWQLIQQIVESVDLRPLQVLIEVTIAEVSRTSDFNLGISGGATRGARGSDPATQSITGVNSTGTDRDLVVRLTGGGGAVDFDVAIHALAERGDVRVLALPIIIAQNNRQAVLNVGSQRPFVQVTQTVPNDPTGRVQTVQYVDVGTKLTITPIINPDGYVNLTVDQTDDAATTELQFDAPIINKRQATTQIFLRDGQTTVIGGLAGRTRNRTTSGVPVLSRIPLLGALFGGQTRNDDTSELFLFLTPHIVSGDDDIDRLRDAVKNGSVLLKQQNLTPMIRLPADTLEIPRDTVRPDPTRPRRPVPSPRPDAAAAARATALATAGCRTCAVAACATRREGAAAGGRGGGRGAPA